MANLHQVINRVWSFSMCTNGACYLEGIALLKNVSTLPYYTQFSTDINYTKVLKENFL